MYYLSQKITIMICSNCKVETKKTITDVWNSEQGQIITQDESLCVYCAEQRGYKNLKKINNGRISLTAKKSKRTTGRHYNLLQTNKL